MQTCKELTLMALVREPIDFSQGLLDNVITPPVSSTIRLVIPPGTYVKKVGHLQYKINAWKGMPSEYRKAINGGVIISHAMVKGLIKTGI